MGIAYVGDSNSSGGGGGSREVMTESDVERNAKIQLRKERKKVLTREHIRKYRERQKKTMETLREQAMELETIVEQMQHTTISQAHSETLRNQYQSLVKYEKALRGENTALKEAIANRYKVQQRLNLLMPSIYYSQAPARVGDPRLFSDKNLFEYVLRNFQELQQVDIYDKFTNNQVDGWLSSVKVEDRKMLFDIRKTIPKMTALQAQMRCWRNFPDKPTYMSSVERSTDYSFIRYGGDNFIVSRMSFAFTYEPGDPMRYLLCYRVQIDGIWYVSVTVLQPFANYEWKAFTYKFEDTENGCAISCVGRFPLTTKLKSEVAELLQIMLFTTCKMYSFPTLAM